MATTPSPEFDGATPLRTETDRLCETLRRLLHRHLSTDRFRPAISLFGLSAGEPELLRRGSGEPEDAVLGFTLPAAYDAMVVVASSVVAVPPSRAHRDAAVALGVARQGSVVSLLATSERVVETDHPQGWLIDACLRAVGLPTPPCAVAALALPIAIWLDRLMVTIVTQPHDEPIDWDTAVALCPIPARWRSDDPVDLGTTLGSTTRSWRSLRAAVRAGEPTAVAMSPSRAGWMDDAMFARWCMGAFPDLASLRGDVEFLAPDVVAQGVELALRAAWAAFDG